MHASLYSNVSSTNSHYIMTTKHLSLEFFSHLICNSDLRPTFLVSLIDLGNVSGKAHPSLIFSWVMTCVVCRVRSLNRKTFPVFSQECRVGYRYLWRTLTSLSR